LGKEKKNYPGVSGELYKGGGCLEGASVIKGEGGKMGLCMKSFVEVKNAFV
jgi:hypothetical protein